MNLANKPPLGQKQPKKKKNEKFLNKDNRNAALRMSEIWRGTKLTDNSASSNT